jgi:hypothetical protein
MCSQPYWNDWIIATIWNTFLAGEKSLATSFSNQFPTSEDSNGVIKLEVPPWSLWWQQRYVKISATLHICCTNEIKLYIALYEWRSGTYHAVDFATNTFLDVYQGHLSTMAYIRENKVDAYHAMMRDIQYIRRWGTFMTFKLPVGP